MLYVYCLYAKCPVDVDAELPGCIARDVYVLPTSNSAWNGVPAKSKSLVIYTFEECELSVDQSIWFASKSSAHGDREIVAVKNGRVQCHEPDVEVVAWRIDSVDVKAPRSISDRTIVHRVAPDHSIRLTTYVLERAISRRVVGNQLRPRLRRKV